MDKFIQRALNQRRSMKVALADMLAEYERNPRPPLARTIALMRDEIENATLFRRTTDTERERQRGLIGI
jgi:hypothetical protein